MSAPLVRPEYSNPPRFVLAATGQQILLRGVNVIQTAADADRRAAVVGIGCNMVRVVTNWHLLEPNAPAGSGSDFSSYTHTLDSAAIAQIDADLQYYADNGLYFQLDFHQSSWSPYFGGSGIPNWYYQDARFMGGAYAQGANSADKSTAIKNWWIGTEASMAQQLYIGYVKAVVAHVLAQPYADHLVGYQVFNEPNAGNMTGSQATKTGNIHSWLAPVVDAIHLLDPDRGKFVMCRGGSQGFGSATFSAFGDLVAKRIVAEYHQYYTGLAPGYPAVSNPDVGYDSAGDDYFPNSAAVHTTTSGSTYTGQEQYQEAFMNVPLGKAAALGVPAFQGEMGVHPDDSGRLSYIAHVQQALDNLKVSGTVWKLGRYPGDSLGLLDGTGNLNDCGQAWQAWFQSTQYIIGGDTPRPPANTSLPTVSDPTPVVGETVTCDPGVWTGFPAPAFTFKWQLQDPVLLGWIEGTGVGAETDTYTIDPSDEGKPLRCKVTGTNTEGTADAFTAATADVAAAPAGVPVCTTPPAVTPATSVQAGTALTSDNGSWTNTPTGYAYQWQRKDPSTGTVTAIAGATSATYTPVSADEAYQLACAVTASNGSGSGNPATSNYTAAPAAGGPVASLRPATSDQGAPQVGEVISVDVGVWSPPPTSYAYQWQTDSGSGGVTWTDLAGETGATYTVQAGDVGNELRVKVIAAASGGATSTASAATSAVVAGGGEPVVTEHASLDNTTPYEGDLLTVTDPVCSPAATSFTYLWKRQTPAAGDLNGTIATIAGATSKTYTTTVDDVGSRVFCEVTAVNGSGSHTTTTTPRTALVQSGTAPSFAVTWDDPFDGEVVTKSVLPVRVEIDGTPSGAQARADGGAWVALTFAGMNGSLSIWTGSVTLVGGPGDHTIETQPLR